MIQHLTAYTLGWLRRPELDSPGRFVWEMPDGALVSSVTDVVPIVSIIKPNKKESSAWK
jgi:hypothetical protein